jgi:hypothetical protein
MSITIPHDQLLPDTLQALIEEFVTRAGVRAQLKSGEAVIVFDEEAETCTIVPREQVGKASPPNQP